MVESAYTWSPRKGADRDGLPGRRATARAKARSESTPCVRFPCRSWETLVRHDPKAIRTGRPGVRVAISGGGYSESGSGQTPGRRPARRRVAPSPARGVDLHERVVVAVHGEGAGVPRPPFGVERVTRQSARVSTQMLADVSSTNRSIGPSTSGEGAMHPVLPRRVPECHGLHGGCREPPARGIRSPCPFAGGPVATPSWSPPAGRARSSAAG